MNQFNMATMINFRSIGRKIVCVGRNYRAHALELGNVVPKRPMWFMKPTSSYVVQGQSIRIPPGCINLSHEVELGVVIGSRVSGINSEQAMDCIAGYVVALDMTARDLQDEAKKSGHPWFLCKGFDTSCPVSELISKDLIPNPHSVRLWCKVNGEMRQNSSTCDMLFDIPTLLEHITRWVTLEPGDLLLTGTPDGVGRVDIGDVIECGIGNLVSISFPINH